MAQHPDRRFVHSIIDTLTNGADIGYRGSCKSVTVPNTLSARLHADILIQSINKEIAFGHTVGPFFTPPFSPFVCSSLAVVSKKNGSFRVILDLSRPAGSSVNDSISKAADTVNHSSVDNAISYLVKLGIGSIMRKDDIKQAFRLIPVRSQDWYLLGYQCAGRYDFDCVLPFGSRFSPKLFCGFTDALHWVLNNVSGYSSFVHYCDDFFIIFPPDADLGRRLNEHFIIMCSKLGFPLANKKSEWPTTSITFLGILLDSMN